MFFRCASLSVVGLSADVVEVEVDSVRGLPAFNVVGLGDTAVSESRERVRAAIKNSGFTFPVGRVTVNLAPAHLPKRWPSFDLPIALGILASEQDFRADRLEGAIFLGELALDGSLRPIRGALIAALTAASLGYRRIFVPKENAAEAAFAENIEVISVHSLSHCVNILTASQTIQASERRVWNESSATNTTNAPDIPDFRSIVGQAHAKRAVEIAAAGWHNLLMVGPPGSGKTLLARAMGGILPPLELAEALDVSRVHSVAGLLSDARPIVEDRPFRCIHHTASIASIIGGGRESRPGEASLAHRGVLFLDEMPEFDSRLLESLRQPLEDGTIVVSRVRGSVSYPARFMLVGAANPCPCGYLGDREKPCSCSAGQIARYRAKLSGPILDRIDCFARVPRLTAAELDAGRNTPAEDSAAIAIRVQNARALQRMRAGNNTYTNADIPQEHLLASIALHDDAAIFLRTAAERLGLSARGYYRTLRLGRTIADLLESETLEKAHIAEAIAFREDRSA